MQLLVSVRAAAEVEPALYGGADIIDAKEPSQGSLGPVSAEVLTEILGRVPGDYAVSIALGDVTSPDEIHAALMSLRVPTRAAPIYLKFGFAGERSPDRIESLIATAVRACAKHPGSLLVVAVAYADALRAAVPDPASISHAATRAGAAGVLLDTRTKNGFGLLNWLDPAVLTQWVSNARGGGLITGLAGGLGLEDLELVAAAGPDVVGVRGAACEGGREGWVSAGRVKALRERLGALSGSFQVSTFLSRNA
jgi:uncharacterized protein (UPF0264 family)